MKRMSVRLLLAALVAVFAFGSFAEAAPRKVRHRAKHSSRVSSGSATTPHSTANKHHRPTTKHSTRTHHQSTKPR